MRTFATGLSVLLVSAGALAFAFTGGEGGGGGVDPAEPPPPANTEFAGILLRIGMGADVLAASGMTSEQVATIVGAVESAYSAPTLVSLDEAFMSAKRTHDTLRRTVQSGKGSAQDVTNLRAAEVTLAQATASRDDYLTNLRRGAMTRATAEQAATLERIQANKGWQLPVQYLVKDRSEPEWVALRDTLAARDIAERDPEETFPDSAREALARVDAEAEVAQAKVAHDSNLAGVQTAWNLAASD